MTNTDLDRAEALLSEALGEIRQSDVIPIVTEALAALYRSVGETPKTVAIDAADVETEVESDCRCGSDLLDRGGWRSLCPVHGPG